MKRYLTLICSFIFLLNFISFANITSNGIYNGNTNTNNQIQETWETYGLPQATPLISDHINDQFVVNDMIAIELADQGTYYGINGAYISNYEGFAELAITYELNGNPLKITKTIVVHPGSGNFYISDFGLKSFGGTIYNYTNLACPVIRKIIIRQ